MFCNKKNVNILTASLLAYGIEDAVVCPGSRNAAIVHNLNECATTMADTHPLRLHPVTDERSAAFVAIGLWLVTRRPIVVCVTSGSALLNLLPGVAEASLRHIPLIIISADRPKEWIGQLDGQTLPQPDALLPYAKCWNFPEELDETTIHELCNNALTASRKCGGSCIHINIPLCEPLFQFTESQLPSFTFPVLPDYNFDSLPNEVRDAIRESQHPAVIIGQYEHGVIPAIYALQRMGWTIYAENLSNQYIFNDTLEDIDLLIHIGGCLVEKSLKLQLRSLPKLSVIRIDESDDIPSTFGHVTYKIKGEAKQVLQQVVNCCTSLSNFSGDVAPQPLKHFDIEAMFVGNSTAVRWANRHLHLDVPTYCNRGVNGIEGSLSVAAGYSLMASGKTLCLIGDLSFFYDCNALWNQRLTGNLRILLINNNRGDIFYHLPHLDESPALDDYIAARHESNAHGIAQSYRCTYLSDHTSDLENSIDSFITRLLNEPSHRPVILEIKIDKP